MGGRGASSGISVAGNPYGSQYHALFTVGNIKFVSKNNRQSETLMETMTEGRVYAHVESGKLKSIIYFDSNNKRKKQIDLDHLHLGVSPHAHDGYFHSDFRKNLTTKERKMIDRVIEAMENNKDKL